MKASASRKRRSKYFDMLLPAPVGTVPGTLTADPRAAQTTIQVIAYDPAGAEVVPLEQTSDIKKLVGKHAMLWINVDGFADLQSIELLGEIFGLDKLALEDVLSSRARPKIECYDRCDFVVTRFVMLDKKTLHTDQVSIFFAPSFAISFNERSSGFLDPVRERILKNRGKIRKVGGDYLAYAIVDCVTDHYFAVLNQFASLFADLDDEIFHGASESFVSDVRELRASLVRFLRTAMPARDLINKLISDPSRRMTGQTKPYLKDCLDHVLQVIDQIGTLRQTSTDLINHHHVQMTQKLNETMKVLTIISTIFIPLTFITSIYGMNFDPKASDWNMPELRWAYGYPVIVGIMLTLTVVMLIYFERSGMIQALPRRRRPAARTGRRPRTPS